MAYIFQNRIIYADHSVVLDKALHDSCPDYISDMYESLSSNGSAPQHVKELDNMNNDGSWTIDLQPPK